MNVLVTGANGLLGRQLCTELSEHHQVFALVHAQVENPVANVEYITKDLSLRVDVNSLPKNIDAVFGDNDIKKSNRVGSFSCISIILSWV